MQKNIIVRISDNIMIEIKDKERRIRNMLFKKERRGLVLFVERIGGGF